MPDTSPNALERFLFEPGHSHAKESILMNRLVYDFKISAAKSGYHLECYTSNVDHDGFDIIFDDQDQLKKLQIKTVMQNSHTPAWHIHKRLLRPQLYFIETLGFELSPTGDGVQGGVILMELNPLESSLEVKYFYTDIFIILAFYFEIIYRNNQASRDAIQRIYHDLHSGVSTDQISIPKGCFLSTENPEQVLALAGFHNSISTGDWIQSLIDISLNKFVDGNSLNDSSAADLKNFIAEELQKITDDNVVFAHSN